MKNLSLTFFFFLFFLSFSAIAQNGQFTFTISSSVNTSAGVFKSDGTLVRTLWNNVRYNSGTYTKSWDGKTDDGAQITSPDASYQIKVLTNNVNYAWQGTIGNTSTNMTGTTKHRGIYHCMRGLAVVGSYGYFCTGYSEGSSSMAKFNTSEPNKRIDIAGLSGSTGDVNYVASDGVTVYWAVFDSNSPDNSWVFGTKVSDDSEVRFANGTSYSLTHGRVFPYAISKLSQANSAISGLAVQKSGNFLFVARADLNQLQVLNKTTGAVVQTLSFPNPASLCVDGSDNLWMVSGTNTYQNMW
jgi:hypothetical protein